MTDDKKGQKPPTAEIVQFADRLSRANKKRMAENVEKLSSYLLETVNKKFINHDVDIEVGCSIPRSSDSGDDRKASFIVKIEYPTSATPFFASLLEHFVGIFGKNLLVMQSDNKVQFTIQGKPEELISMVRKIDPKGLSINDIKR